MNLIYSELQDKNWLHHQYVELKKSSCIISKELGSDHQTVLNALDRLGITSRSRSQAKVKYPLLMDKDYLYDQYIIKNRGSQKISEIIGCSHGAVWDALNRHRIPLRSLKETSQGINNPFYGKKHTEHTKKLIANRDISEDTRRKLSKSHMGLQAGDKNPCWRGGISFEPYCPKFNKVLKEKIISRDDRTCQLCGVKGNDKNLTVHHVHYDKPNCEPDLITLCRKCNAKVNFNRDFYEILFMKQLKQRGII